MNYCRYIYSRLDDKHRNSFSTKEALGFDLSSMYEEAREIFKETDENHEWPPKYCPLLGEDITKIFHNVFDSSNPSAPNYFDLKHIGVK